MTGCFCFNTTMIHWTHAVLNLWQNLFSLSWLNCSRGLVSNLTPTGSCIENYGLWFKGEKFFRIDLNCLMDSASLMVLSNLLFHCLTQKGKKECLKLSVLQENSCKLFLFADLVSPIKALPRCSLNGSSYCYIYALCWILCILLLNDSLLDLSKIVSP